MLDVILKRFEEQDEVRTSSAEAVSPAVVEEGGAQ